MKILVTGANGFVGGPLCRVLTEDGHEVHAVVRSKQQGSRAFGQVSVVEIGAETVWGEVLRGVDVVVHLAARVHVMKDSAAEPLAEFLKVNLHGTVNLAQEAVRAGVKRLVYVSSIKVNGERTTESQLFTEFDKHDPKDPYGISKLQAEQALHRIAQETGLEIVIVRPSLVYGIGVKGNFAQMLGVISKGFPLPLASVQNLRSLIYVENLVDALIVCATHPAAAGQTYLVSDGEDISTPGLLRQLGVAMGHPARLLPCPSALLKLAGRLVGKSDQIDRLLGSLRIDSSKIRRELGWQPPYTLQQGLQATAEWYRCHRNGSA